LNVVLRLVSLAVLIAAWYVGAQVAGPRLLPDPQTLRSQSVNGRGTRLQSRRHLARVVASFAIAMAITASRAW
jgi:ABC-type nitrate/sulfonate/bicarbonate transport system permease component